MRDGMDGLWSDAREEFEDGYVAVEALAYNKWLGRQGKEKMSFEAEVDAGGGKGGVVIAEEGIEFGGTYLGAAVATVEVVLEEETDLGDERFAARGEFEGTDDVLAAIAADDTHRKLAAGEDDRLGEVFEHEAERRGGVGHSVGAMEDDEAIIVVVLAFDGFGYVDPRGGSHVGRVDDALELAGVDSVGTPVQLGYEVVDVVEGVWLERTVGVAHHADGAASVNYEDFVGHLIGWVYCFSVMDDSS